MNSYETEQQEFRQRPGHTGLFLFGIASLLLADAIHAAVTWAIETIIAWNSGWESVWIIDIPVLADPRSRFYVAPPLDDLWSHSGEIVGASFLVLGVALIYLWPTRTSLASRLYMHLTATLFVFTGAMAIPLAHTDMLRSQEGFSRVAAGALIIVGYVVLIAIQRSLLVVLQQFWDLHTMSERLLLFATLELPGIVLLGALFWWSGFPAGAFAAAIAIVAIFIATLRYHPRTVYERVTTHSLERGVVVTAVLAIACVAASIWFFGSDFVDRPRKAFTWSPQRGAAIQSHEDIFRQQLRKPETLNEEPVIRWSDPR